MILFTQIIRAIGHLNAVFHVKVRFQKSIPTAHLSINIWKEKKYSSWYLLPFSFYYILKRMANPLGYNCLIVIHLTHRKNSGWRRSLSQKKNKKKISLERRTFRCIYIEIHEKALTRIVLRCKDSYKNR